MLARRARHHQFRDSEHMYQEAKLNTQTSSVSLTCDKLPQTLEDRQHVIMASRISHSQ